MAHCPPRGVGQCSEHKSKYRCNQGYMDHYGDKLCKWSDSRNRCEMSRTPCHDGGIQWEKYQQDESVCLPSTKEPFPPVYKVQLIPEKNEINVYSPRKNHATGKYTLLGTFHGDPEDVPQGTPHVGAINSRSLPPDEVHHPTSESGSRSRKM